MGPLLLLDPCGIIGVVVPVRRVRGGIKDSERGEIMEGSSKDRQGWGLG